MTPYDYYITPEEYARAAAVGIRPRTLDRRIRLLGWAKERALTTPPQVKRDRSRWRKVAELNGISAVRFYDRVNRYGWTEERAATEPLCSPEKSKELMIEATRMRSNVAAAHILELRKQNGISIQTYHYRVRRMGWSPERAATEPPMSRQEVGRLGHLAVRKRYGDINATIFERRR